jgi:HD-like signal output (HDOD) protein
VSILRTANSTVFSPRKKIENLTQAIALIGISQLESLILSIGVGTAIPRKAAPGYDFVRFWKTAAKRGVIAAELASVLCPIRKSDSFTAGLLQDMAIPLLAHQKPEEYGAILGKWHEKGGDLAELERERFPWDHAEIATWICSEWGLPEKIASAIGGHHGSAQDLYDCPAPVSLVAHITEEENSSGVEKLIQAMHQEHGMEEEWAREIIASNVEKADDLAHMMI